MSAGDPLDALAGTWPGDETDEELADALHEFDGNDREYLAETLRWLLLERAGRHAELVRQDRALFTRFRLPPEEGRERRACIALALALLL